jgi:hypothetical protein
MDVATDAITIWADTLSAGGRLRMRGSGLKGEERFDNLLR